MTLDDILYAWDCGHMPTFPIFDDNEQGELL